MKKVIAVIAVAALVGVASSWAATITTNVERHDVTLKGKLSPSGTAVTGKDLAGTASNTISILDLQIIEGTTTNEDEVIVQIIGTATNLLLRQVAGVDLTPTATNALQADKFVGAFASTNGAAINRVLLVAGSSKGKIDHTTLHTNTVIKAKFQGIWYDGSNIVAGTIQSVK